MDDHWRELDVGEIHFRDLWQFELISDYYPSQSFEENTYAQEFYIFIPNALHVNQDTYFKPEFYQDQTSLIRLKTPVFTFSELLNFDVAYSPFFLLRSYLKEEAKSLDFNKVEYEFKLLANILRSAIRDQVNRFVHEVQLFSSRDHAPTFNRRVNHFCEDLKVIRNEFERLIKQFSKKTEDQVFRDHLRYINEFISYSINDYITGLVEIIRSRVLPDLQPSDEHLCEVVIREKREEEVEKVKETDESAETSVREEILYRRGILNKFVLDALLLKTNRASLDVKLGHWIGAISAGIAMLVYVLFFVWQGHGFLINSQPYIILTVLVYVLKDRLKEIFKAISFRQAFKWFSDYKTKIISPNTKEMIGEIRESFSFVSVDKLPEDIVLTRNVDFHDWLRRIRRPENVIYYKRKVILQKEKSWRERLNNLTIIFRFDIHRFLSKASNPVQHYSTIDPVTRKIIHKRLPKVYHINIIMKSTYLLEDKVKQIEIKKFRLIVDKNGIKRIEKISGHVVSQQKKIPHPDEEI